MTAPVPAPTVLPPAVLRRHKRLVSRLDELNVHLRILEGAGPAAHLAAARLYWDEARGMLGRGDADAAWYAYNAAHRELLRTATEQELEDHATLLAAEASKKLTSWRRDTVLALLDARGACDLAERRRRVALAMRVRDDHAVDRFYKINVLRRQLVLLGVILFAALAAAVAVMWARGLSFDTAMAGQPAGGPLLVLVALFGAVGGSFSASIGVARANVDGRIPGPDRRRARRGAPAAARRRGRGGVLRLPPRRPRRAALDRRARHVRVLGVRGGLLGAPPPPHGRQHGRAGRLGGRRAREGLTRGGSA